MSNLEFDQDFDLDEEVQAWCRAVHPYGWNRRARREELADHLYCEIEQLQAAGLAQQAAFRAATAQLGEVAALQSEHTKNATQTTSFVTKKRSIRRADMVRNYCPNWHRGSFPAPRLCRWFVLTVGMYGFMQPSKHWRS